ncbi:MAG: orotidine-5'-phosphate decarboxylase [Candidatus Omnitrophica bacterium]|nr:orotidine-5'-phosphate decarboxylase [Candidatus Omnitrophota bacterium]
MKERSRLIVALDVDTFDEARRIIDELGDIVDIFKVGSHLFVAHGPSVIRGLQAKGKKIFLDLKFHDIPNTVAGAVRSAVSLRLFMLTVHAQGGLEMLQAASKAAKEQAVALDVPRPLIIGVTVLTSQARDADTNDIVMQRALLAKQAGLDGVVASVEEAALVRGRLGQGFIIVTPGIRPAGTDAGDQKRAATPAAAMKSGSDFLVVGRPIVQDKDPRAAALRILKELSSHPP